MTDAPETIHIWQLKGSQWKMGGWDLVPESGPAYTRADLIAAARAEERERCAAEIKRLRRMAYQPGSTHETGCDCIQCVPF
jgi:hypothetical protein